MSKRFALPWTYKKNPEVRYDERTGEKREYAWHEIHSADGRAIFFLSSHSDEESLEAEQLCRRIMALPEMFEALEMVRDADEDCKKDGLPQMPSLARAKIDAALAKIEGKENEPLQSS